MTASYQLVGCLPIGPNTLACCHSGAIWTSISFSSYARLNVILLVISESFEGAPVSRFTTSSLVVDLDLNFSLTVLVQKNF